MADKASTKSFSVESTSVASGLSIQTKDWHAWNNLMPPKPDDFHVTGWVLVSNPGVDVYLHRREPQGINPVILLLDLFLIQKQGIWPQHLVWKQARYDEAPTAANHLTVEVGANGQTIATIKVENIH